MSDVELEAAVRELVAKQAITDVIHRYCRALDRMDREAAVSVWHPDGVADYGAGIFQGTGEGFVDWVWKAHARHRLHQHRVSNIMIAVRDDRAVSETYISALIYGVDADGNERQAQSNGRYIDEWSRRDGVWAIDRRTYTTDFGIINTTLPMPECRSTRDEHDPSHAVLRRFGVSRL